MVLVETGVESGLHAEHFVSKKDSSVASCSYNVV